MPEVSTPRKGDCHRLENIVLYIVRPCFKINQPGNQPLKQTKKRQNIPTISVKSHRIRNAKGNRKKSVLNSKAIS